MEDTIMSCMWLWVRWLVQMPLFYESKLLLQIWDIWRGYKMWANFHFNKVGVYEPVHFVSQVGLFYYKKGGAYVDDLKWKQHDSQTPYAPSNCLLICVHQSVLIFAVYIDNCINSLTMKPTTLLYWTCVHSLTKRHCCGISTGHVHQMFSGSCMKRNKLTHQNWSAKEKNTAALTMLLFQSQNEHRLWLSSCIIARCEKKIHFHSAGSIDY